MPTLRCSATQETVDPVAEAAMVDADKTEDMVQTEVVFLGRLTAAMAVLAV